MKKTISLDNSSLLVDESLYSTANGYIGVRGNFEEGYGSGYDSIRGTYINGLYDIVDVTYGENAHGFPQTAQKMPAVIDPQGIEVYAGGIRLDIFSEHAAGMERELDIWSGTSKRSFTFEHPKGGSLSVQIRRMTSFDMQELFVIEYSVSSEGYTGDIEIVSDLKGDVQNYTNPNDPRVASGHARLLEFVDSKAGHDHGVITLSAKRSGHRMSAAFTHNLDMAYSSNEKMIEARCKLEIAAGETVTLVKYVAFTDSIRHENLIENALLISENAKKEGSSKLFESQQTYMDDFWARAKIAIEGDEKTTYALNYSIYQLLSSAGKVKRTNIPAKGLSGEGYEGHYFWDTEIYMLPLFTLTSPDIAKNLLRFRYETLDMARERSLEMGHKGGAKIPWRTIAGSECSAYFPAGSAQYHINADVAYSYIQYYLYTGDLEFMKDCGYEVLLETARLWTEIGHFGDDGKFRIDAVTGPDEYTAVVNNNYYTNAMASYHLLWTVRMAEILGITLDDELYEMKRAGTDMHLPFDEELQICLQDDAFKYKAEWDFENTPKENYPLLLHYHPLIIYRYKVLKQADTVLAHMLLDNEPDLVMKNTYEYYERLTTHDSSLSPAVHSMMASRINDPEKAYKYFMETIMLDLDNLHGNTKDGLHIANAGGAYMSMIYGFAGLRIKEDGLHLRPTKPLKWPSYTFRLSYRGRVIEVKVADEVVITTDGPVFIFIDDVMNEVDGTKVLPYSGRH